MEYKFIATYQSPNTDDPNKKFRSEPIFLTDMVNGENFQVDFTDGSYLMANEMEPECTTWELLDELKEKLDETNH